MIKYLATRRFNYIDSTFNVMTALSLVDQNWIKAAVMFSIGICLSIYLEGK